MPSFNPTPARSFRSWLLVIFSALAITVLVHAFVFQSFSIPSRSMYPTLIPGDRLVANKLSARYGPINTGDIIVFHAPAMAHTSCVDPYPDLVKRVIGLPGQRIYSKGGVVYINGSPLKESWPTTKPFGPAISDTIIPPNEYYVLGDNRALSCDSRDWGLVPRSAIIAKVFLRYYPLSRLAWF